MHVKVRTPAVQSLPSAIRPVILSSARFVAIRPADAACPSHSPSPCACPMSASTAAARAVLRGIDLVGAARQHHRGAGAVGQRQVDPAGGADRRTAAGRGHGRSARASRCRSASAPLLELRKGIGVLLQGNGLLTDLTVAENVALPLRTHTNLPRAGDRPAGGDEAARGRPARRRRPVSARTVRRHGAARRAGAGAGAGSAADDLRRTADRARPDRQRA